jgi:hypothetical protein
VGCFWEVNFFFGNRYIYIVNHLWCLYYHNKINFFVMGGVVMVKKKSSKIWLVFLGAFALLFIVVSVFATTIYEFKSGVYAESMKNLVSSTKTITKLQSQSFLGNLFGGNNKVQQSGVEPAPVVNCVVRHPEVSYSLWNSVRLNTPVDDYSCWNNWGVSYFREHSEVPAGLFPVTVSVVTYNLPPSLADESGRVYLQTSECAGVSGYVQSRDSPFRKKMTVHSGNVSEFLVIPMCGVSGRTEFTPFAYSGEGFPQFVNMAGCGQGCIAGVRAYYIKPLFNTTTVGEYHLYCGGVPYGSCQG